MAGAEQKSDKPAPPAPDDAPKKPAVEQPQDELSEEDQALKDKLDMLVVRARDSDTGVQKLALQTIRTEIRSATSSMTSVPKPLKFLRPHFTPLKVYYATEMPEGDNRIFLADVLSVLAMTMGDASKCESLRFKLQGTEEAPHLWGHEYVRHLAGEIASEYQSLVEMDAEMRDDTPEQPNGDVVKLPQATIPQITKLVDDIVPFLMKSNAEPEAVDLLMEVDSLPKLKDLADEHNYSRVCLYLKACADYVLLQEDIDKLLKIASDIYFKVGKLPDAMQVAIRRGDMDSITAIYESSDNPSPVRLQLALDLGRAGILLDEIETDDDMLMAMRNQRLTDQFKALAKDLDVLEPKTPDDIYKTHLLDARAPSASSSDSARANLAKTFVNAFVNMGFGTDKLMSDNDNKWIYRNREHGMMSAAASVGMILLWDVETGLSDIDKYMHVEQDFVRAGALLGVGLVSANVRHEVDPALAIIQDHLNSNKASIRNGAIAGLGLAYAGTQNATVKDLLLPILTDKNTSADTVALTALSLGLCFVGTLDGDVSIPLLEVLSERQNTGDVTREALLPILLPLALGLLYLGSQEAAEVMNETIAAMVGTDSLLGRITSITFEVCAYCGSGDVRKVQKFLSICGEHASTEENDDATDSNQGSNARSQAAAQAGSTATNGAENESNANANGTQEASSDAKTLSDAEKARIASAEQAVAVLGLAMVAMGEELGAEMSIRAFGHLLQYGDPVIRKVVPLAIGLLSISDPKLTLTDMLSKFTHDSDMEVAQSAIIGLGLIGAGTNNSRIAGILRQLSQYYAKEGSSLFLVRIAQGILHSAKGLVTMNPFYGDNNFLQSKTALSGILTVLFSCLDMKGTVLGKNHYLLYYLALAARPRMVFTVDEKMEFKATTVRVGQAVDTVGQAGRPKSITGFQTHTTPVLLAAGERSEMATDEFLSVAASMEGLVVLEKNPDWVDESGLTEAAAAMEKIEEEAAKHPQPASQNPTASEAGPSSMATS
ncbi:26S proteasome non-ATPase regulatory subunit RPN1 [Gracilaria domingensis]|nr:26S proteasome non-ATPase regulatory subunit RPN1 [Gracilaria domingensis]